MDALTISQQISSQKTNGLPQQRLLKSVAYICSSSRLCHKWRCLRAVWLALLLLFTASLSADPQIDERLEYSVSYQGGLTAMAWLDISDAVLETSQQMVTVNGEAAYKVLVKISSEQHPKMEQVYPFRYQLISYFSTDLQRSILFDRYKKTRKERHEIIRFDWNKRRTERYKRRKQPGEASYSSEIEGIFRYLGYDAADFRRSGKPGQKLSSNMLDRLSLLQAVRGQTFAVGDELRFTIADGKKVLNYRVRVQAQETLEQDLQKRVLFKLRFDAFKAGEWSGQPVHPAVFVWMSADARKIPVRFVIDYALGRFIVQLKPKAEGEAAMAKTLPLVQPSPAH